MANKAKKPTDISNFKKQRNYVVNLNKQAKFEYFSSYNSADSKPFWVNCKPIFLTNTARLILILF